MIRQNVAYGNTAIILVPDDLLHDYEPDGFIEGYRIQQQLPDGKWKALCKKPEEGDACIRIRQRDGRLALMEAWPYENERTARHQLRDEWMEQTDGPCALAPLPSGNYRFNGLEFTDKELRRLLPVLDPDLQGVLYRGSKSGRYHFWTVGGKTGQWHDYQLMTHLLDTQSLPTDQVELYRVYYQDFCRPEKFEIALQTGFAILHYRPVPGPVVLEPIDLKHLSRYWPVEKLYDVLTPEQLVVANLKPGPHEVL